jgi:hypothetical protein
MKQNRFSQTEIDRKKDNCTRYYIKLTRIAPSCGKGISCQVSKTWTEPGTGFQPALQRRKPTKNKTEKGEKTMKLKQMKICISKWA